MIMLRERVDHQTTPEPRLVRQANCSRKRQVSAGAISCNDHLAIVGGQRVEVVDNPSRCRHGVFMGRGEGILRGQPIIDGHDRTVGLISKPQAERMVGIQIADCPAATVEVDDERTVPGAVIHPRPKCLLG